MTGDYVEIRGQKSTGVLVRKSPACSLCSEVDIRMQIPVTLPVSAVMLAQARDPRAGGGGASAPGDSLQHRPNGKQRLYFLKCWSPVESFCFVLGSTLHVT